MFVNESTVAEMMPCSPQFLSSTASCGAEVWLGIAFVHTENQALRAKDLKNRKGAFAPSGPMRRRFAGKFQDFSLYKVCSHR